MDDFFVHTLHGIYCAEQPIETRQTPASPKGRPAITFRGGSSTALPTTARLS